MDPIATLIRIAGEPGTLRTPSAVANFDPTASPDFVPAADGLTDVRCIPVGPDEELPDGAIAAAVIGVSELPDGLSPQVSGFDWRGKAWTIMKTAERRYLGKINGYTLYLSS